MKKLYRVVGFRDEETKNKYGDLLNKVVEVKNSVKVEINANTAQFWQEKCPNLEFGQVFTINYVWSDDTAYATFGFYEDLPEMEKINRILLEFLSSEEPKIV